MSAGAQPVATVPISYVEKPNGDIIISVDPHKRCKRGNSIGFSLTPNCDAVDFLVTFKNGKNPFGPNGNPDGNKINKAYPFTGTCTGANEDYDYTVVLIKQNGNTVTFDPVIIVDGP